MAGCEPPPIDMSMFVGLPAHVREPRVPLQVDCVHECAASLALGKIAQLADWWETEAACTDTHGAYMRSMVTEIREIIGQMNP